MRHSIPRLFSADFHIDAFGPKTRAALVGIKRLIIPPIKNGPLICQSSSAQARMAFAVRLSRLCLPFKAIGRGLHSSYFCVAEAGRLETCRGWRIT